MSVDEVDVVGPKAASGEYFVLRGARRTSSEFPRFAELLVRTPDSSAGGLILELP